MNYKTKTLKNGVRVVAVETEEFKAIYADMRVLGGSVFEDESNNGISHLVEHIMLHGNAKYKDDSKFDDALERLGGTSNGATSEVGVNAYVIVPNTELDFALEHLYHTAATATFIDKNIKHEKSVVSDEIHNFESDPYYDWYEYWNTERHTKDNTPLFVIGKKPVVNGFSSEQLTDWYHTMFNPKNIVLTIVGDIDPDECIMKVEKLFGDLKGEEKFLQLEHIQSRTLASNVISTMVDTTRDEALGSLSFPIEPLFKTTLEDRTVTMLLNLIIVSLRNSILYKKLRKDLGWLYHISGNVYQYPTFNGLVEIHFSTSSDKVANVYEVIFKELETLLEKGISPKMFDYAMESSINTQKMNSISLGKMVKHIHGYYYWFDKVISIEEMIEKQKAITLDEVNSKLKDFINYEDMAIISRVHSDEYKKELHRRLKKSVKEFTN